MSMKTSGRELSAYTLLARNSERPLVTNDPGATGKFSEIPMEIHWNSTGNQCQQVKIYWKPVKPLNDQCHGTDIPSCTWVTGAC